MNGAAPDTTPTTPAIALERLTRRWGTETVLRGVSLQLTAGRVVALRGRNGSGKTTLLRVLATRLRPSTGRAQVFGHDVVREGAAVRRCVAYLSVQSGSHGPLTAAENLRLAATLLAVPPGEVRERVARALERVGLQAHANRPVRVFSSGMKRRLGLARLLLADAPLWLLDEPYASLDEDGRHLVDALLRQAGREGRTVLLASHEAERIAPLVDAQLTLDQGRLSKVASDSTVAIEEAAPAAPGRSDAGRMPAEAEP